MHGPPSGIWYVYGVYIYMYTDTHNIHIYMYVHTYTVHTYAGISILIPDTYLPNWRMCMFHCALHSGSSRIGALLIFHHGSGALGFVPVNVWTSFVCEKSTQRHCGPLGENRAKASEDPPPSADLWTPREFPEGPQFIGYVPG